MATESLANHSYTTVGTGGVTSTATTLPVAAYAGFPTTGQYRVVVDPGTSSEELMLVTAGQGTTSWTVTRAAEVTNNGVQTAFAHSAGAAVAHVLSVGGLSGWVETMPTATASALATGPLDLPLNAQRDFRASGLTTSHTGSISAAGTTLTLTAAGDFADPYTNTYGTQQAGIGVANVGTTCTLTAPTGVAVTQQGTTGSTSYTVTVVAVDSLGGCTAASTSANATNGNAALATASPLKVTWTAASGASKYAVYVAGIGYVGQTAGTTFYVTSNTAATAPLGIPTSSPSAATRQNLYTTVSSGGSTTSVTLADAATAAGSSVAVIHDDTAAIKAALSAAHSNSLPLRVPYATYNLSGEIDITPLTEVRCDSGAVFDFANAPGDGVVLQPGFHSPLEMVFGEIDNCYGGAALKLYGAQEARVKFGVLNGGYDLLVMAADSTNTQCSGNRIDGLLCQNAQRGGVVVSATETANAMQLNRVVVNQTDFCTTGMLFDAPSGQSPNWTYNVFDLATIAGENLPDSQGIASLNGVGVSNNTFYCREFFSQFGSYLLNISGNANYFELKADTQIGAVNMKLGTGEGNRVININQASQPAYSATPIAAATASNSQSSWNGGWLTGTRRTHLSITVPSGGLASGSTQDAYMYHAFLSGNTNDLIAVPRWASAPMIIVACEDESAVAGVDGNFGVAFQVHVRVLAVGAVAAGTYDLDVIVEG